MNNEPVAWAYIKDGEFWDAIHPDEHAKEEGSYDIPLYTHPANPKYDPETGEPLIDGYPLFSGLPPPPAKTLTDEEIIDIACKSLIATTKIETDFGNASIDFARAILRKAQEK
jgi:hypothetical protein